MGRERLMSSENKDPANSVSGSLVILWHGGVFESARKFNDILQILGEKGKNFSKPKLGLALSRAKFLTRRGRRGFYEYVQRFPSVNEETDKIEVNLFSKRLAKKLEANFSEEMSDLNWNFGKSGTCTAFLLRKILEKLIFLTFAKNRLDAKLKDAEGKFIGLEAMVNLASSEKIEGLHFLMPSTAKSIKGAKFLGDTSAHNPLTNVAMKTIIPQMPFIITAYEELSRKL